MQSKDIPRQPIKWEKILASDTTDKGLVFKFYKQLMQLYIYLKKIKKGTDI